MIACPKCGQPLPAQASGVEAIVACGTCQREIALIFLSDQPQPVSQMASEALAGEPSCFFCPQKAARSSCESCGRYVCADCTAAWFGQQLCLSCVYAQREVKGDLNFRSRVTLYDNLALMLMLLPLLTIPIYGVFFAAITSPVSLYLAVRHRQASRGIVPRGPARTIAAVVLATLFLLGGIFLVGFVGWSIAQDSDAVPLEEMESSPALEDEPVSGETSPAPETP